MGKDDSLVWRCSCGQEWSEDGSGFPQGQAWGHLTKLQQVYGIAQRLLEGRELTKRQQTIADQLHLTVDNADKIVEHKAIGLVNKKSGEVLLSSFNAMLAQRAGYTRKREGTSWDVKQELRERREAEATAASAASAAQAGDEDEEEQAEAGDEIADRRKGGRGKGGGAKGPGDGEGKKRQQPASPFKGRMVPVNIPISPELYFLYLAAATRFPDLDGSPESVGEWLQACVTELYQLFPRVFGVDKLMAALEEGRSNH